MRILMISKACVVGSYQRKLEEIARSPDMQLTVVVPPEWRERGSVQRLERAHTQGYDLRAEPLALNGHFHVHFYPTLGRVIREVAPDLVHIDEEPYNLATYLAARQAVRAGALVVFFTWQTIAKRYPPPFAWFERYTYTHAAYAIAGVRDAAAVLCAKGFGGPVAVIPQFGADPEVYHPLDVPHSTKRPVVIGYAGRMVEEKGLMLLLDSVAGMQGDWRLLLIGDGPLLEALKGRVRQLRLDAFVTFIERLPSTAMPIKLRELDILVLPSHTRPNWKEQFGRVLIEAMASEVAVVGSSSGEIPNVIGETGVVFPEGDAGSLRFALEDLVRDPRRRRELAEAGRARVLAHFTQEQVAARTVEVYREALGLADSASAAIVV